MKNYNDEQLSAYIDGELSGEEVAELEEALRQDRRIAARVADLRSADEAVRIAYNPIRDHPRPPRITALFTFEPSRRGRDHFMPGHVIAASESFSRWRQALLASLALMAGLFIGGLFPFGSKSRIEGLYFNAQATPADKLFKVLEKTYSGDITVLNSELGIAATPVLSFALKDGRRCREFVVSSSEQGIRAVGCRTPNTWETVIAVKAGNDLLLDDQYRAASAASEPLISFYLDNAMDGDAFGREEERSLIKQGWALLEDK